MNFSKKLAGIIILGALEGCALSGRVVGKQYQPEKKWIEIRNLTLSNGDYAETGRVPIYCADDEDFIIDVKYNQKGEERFFIKDRVSYDKLIIGSKFKHDSKTSEKTDPVKKRRLSEREWEEFIRNGNF